MTRRRYDFVGGAESKGQDRCKPEKGQQKLNVNEEEHESSIDPKLPGQS